MAIFSAMPNTLTNGQTADATQVMANFNQLVSNGNSGCAENGTNSSITQLTGLTTALTVGQGGTGQKTARLALQSLSGAFIVGKSGTAVSCTADTNEDTLATITIPANAIGANGVIRFEFNVVSTNNANVKTIRIRFSGGAGTVVASVAVTSTAASSFWGNMANANATNSQLWNTNGTSPTPSLLIGANNAVSAIDTTAQTTIVITGQKASAGDALTLNNFLFVLHSDGT